MKILVASPIDPAALAWLARTHDLVNASGSSELELRALLHDREVLIFRSGVKLPAEVLRCGPRLRLLIRAGSGTDNLDLDYIAAKGLQLVRIPQPGARAVAELTFGLMLTLARGILYADSAWRRGHWAKHEITGFLLRGKVLGVVGAGNIGTQVGKLGVAWGMEVLGCVDPATPQEAERLGREAIRLASFDEVVSSADFLSIHVPLQPSTRNLINASVLARMKPDAFLLNLARGGVVDEQALRLALLRGERPRGAALDVHALEGEGQISPLADLPNVVLTPHIGAGTVDTQREIGERIVDELIAFCGRQKRAPALAASR